MAKNPTKTAAPSTAPPPQDKDERDPAPPAPAPAPTTAPAAPTTPPEQPKADEQPEQAQPTAKAPKAPKPAAQEKSPKTDATASTPGDAPTAQIPKRSLRTASKGQAVATYGTSKMPRHFGQVQDCMNKPGGLMVKVRLDGSTADDEDILLPLYGRMDDEQRQQLRDGGITAWAEWPN